METSKVSITIQFDSIEEANSFLEKGKGDLKSKKELMGIFAQYIKMTNKFGVLKISYIKCAREMFNLSLVEAKVFVEDAIGNVT